MKRFSDFENSEKIDEFFQYDKYTFFVKFSAGSVQKIKAKTFAEVEQNAHKYSDYSVETISLEPIN